MKTLKTSDRVVAIEMAARRLNMDVEVSSRAMPEYVPPSVEEDMQDFNIHVFGDPNYISPEVEVSCEM